MPQKLPDIFIYGAGKVGSALANELRIYGEKVTLRGARKGLPKGAIKAPFVILAVRDRDIGPTAEEMVRRGIVGHQKTVIVHCAGALGPEPLAGVRGPKISVAQMHPMISFADKARAPFLPGGNLHVDGDPAAVRAATALGKRIGMSPRTIPGLDKVAYHAAAGLVANGAAALAAAGLALLEKAGVSREVAAAMLGPLLSSVGGNVKALGLPAALTGPIRRGDAGAVGRHLEVLRRLQPEIVPIYLAAGELQVPLARVLGEAPAESFDAIEKVLEEGAKRG